MKYIYVGDIVNTHGIKGELRIISDFEYKDKIFKKDFKIYIGKNKEEQIINTYRVHKIFDMITFKGFTNINEVLKYKKQPIYINKEDIEIDGYFDEDIIGLSVYMKDKLIGKITKILKNVKYSILVLDNKNMVPNIPQFIEKIDLDNHKIIIKEIEGLINEN